MSQPSVSLSPDGTVQVPWDRIERFLGQYTHDIRNGLNALELQLTFLGEISTDPEAVEEVKRIRESLADTAHQLQAVRLSTGIVRPSLLDYPAADFFEDIRERFERQEPAGAARTDWQVNVGAVSLRIDPQLTMAALLEVLGNALQFAVPGSRFRSRADATGETVTLTLRETAASVPAISPDQWGRTPFQSSQRAAYGLGLFRVRRIIEAQSGTYEAAYDASAGEVVSTITFPLAPA